MNDKAKSERMNKHSNGEAIVGSQNSFRFAANEKGTVARIVAEMKRWRHLCSAQLQSLLFKIAAIASHQSTMPKCGLEQVDSSYDFNKNALLRHLPALRKLVRWRPIGTYPTPLHQAHLQLSAAEVAEILVGSKRGSSIDRQQASPTGFDYTGLQVDILLKREDLSHSKYAGLKLRSLEFCLPYTREGALMYPCTYGSNIALMACAHRDHGQNTANSNTWAIEQGIIPLPCLPETSSAENDRRSAERERLCANGPNANNHAEQPPGDAFYPRMSMWNGLLVGLRERVFRGRRFLPIGFASVQGCLGNTSLAFELLEQLQQFRASRIQQQKKREAPSDHTTLQKRETHFFLGLGSGTTLAGLVLGIALCRYLKLGYFDPDQTTHLENQENKGASLERGVQIGLPIIHAVCLNPTSLRLLGLNGWVKNVDRLLRETVPVLTAAGYEGDVILRDLCDNIMPRVRFDSDYVGTNHGGGEEGDELLEAKWTSLDVQSAMPAATTISSEQDGPSGDSLYAQEPNIPRLIAGKSYVNKSVRAIVGHGLKWKRDKQNKTSPMISSIGSGESESAVSSNDHHTIVYIAGQGRF